MTKKLHPLVKETKLILEKLDKQGIETWGERKSYEGSLMPISVEPKLRNRALNFMNELILLLESNGHSIKIKYDRLHIEMYGHSTEFNLRQKFYRKRAKEKGYSYSHNIFVKSNDLEFQVGSYARKNWIDKKTKRLEDYIPAIYRYIEKDSKRWFELRRDQKIEEEKRERQRKLEEEKQKLIAIENEKTETLIKNSTNFKKAKEIRFYLKALEEKQETSQTKSQKMEEYIKWGYQKANEIDPLIN
tara:strand:- start:3883 stop:4617 length:735 start_codon:yes stop_codon:yes gene_type:complete